MAILFDEKKNAKITMTTWTGTEYTPDISDDFFQTGGTPLKVEDVDYCIDMAIDWKKRRGDFCDDGCEGVYQEHERVVDIEEIEMTIKFEEYRDKAGIGVEMVFNTVEEAISHAKKLWDHHTERDKDSYRNDPAAFFCVTVNEDMVFDMIKADKMETLVSDCVDNLIYLEDDRDMDGKTLSASEAEAEAADYIRDKAKGFTDEEKDEMIEKAIKEFNSL